jgi:hypothetical protein
VSGSNASCKPYRGVRIERSIPDDLLTAIYKREGWTPRDRAGFNSRSARCNELYEITADPRRNRYIAVRKCCSATPTPEAGGVL